MAKKPKFSMRPEQAEEGLFGNVRAKIVDAFYGTYGEHAPENLSASRTTGDPDDPCGVIEFEQEGVDDNVKQFFSCGSCQRLVPSEDNETQSNEGPFVIPAEGSPAHGINKSTRMYSLLSSLSKPAEGKLKFNSALLDEVGLKALIGIEGFWARVPAPLLSSVAVEEGATEKSMLICREIFELPTKGAGAKKGKAKDEKESAKSEPEGDDDVKTEAQGIVVSVLEAAGEKGVARKDLVKKCFNGYAKSKNRRAIIELLQDEEFASDDDAPWSYDEKEERLTEIK